MTAVPALAGVQRHHRECPPELPAWAGSPDSRPARAFVVASTVSALPGSTDALANASLLAAAAATIRTRRSALALAPRLSVAMARNVKSPGVLKVTPRSVVNVPLA